MNPTPSSEQVRRQRHTALFLACVAVVLAPLVLRGTSCGQDFDFHFESWMGASHQWLQGNLFPHWIASANYGAGEPRFIFYPPLSWILGGILGTFLPWTWTPIVFTTLCLLAMGAACYKMAREWIPPDNAALATCLYVINPYILFVVYERSALAELLAAIWLPLLFLYALRPARVPTQTAWKHLQTSVPPLALIIAALWLTDAPAAVMGSYALAVIVAVAAISERRFALIVRAVAGMALGLSLAAVYLIPAIYEQRWVEIANAIGIGMRIQDSFLFEHTGMAYHDQVLRTASWIAVVLLAATIIAAALCWRSRRLRTLRLPFSVLIALIAFLLFPISKPIWNHLPELRFLQFPWRWLLVLGFIFATFAAASLGGSIRARRGKIFRAAIVLALAVLFTTHAWRHFWLLCDDQDNIHAQLAAREQGFEGTDEYTPDAADNAAIQQNLSPVRFVSSPQGDQADGSEENPDWQPDEHDLVPAIIQIRRWNVEHMTAEIQSPQSGYAVLRLMDYPAWRVAVNGQPVSRHEHRGDGLLSVPIPAGTSTIDVRYAATPDIWAGRVVSLASLTLWLALAAKSCRRRVIM